MIPPRKPFAKGETHRLISALYSERQTVLADVVDDEAMLEDVIFLDGASDDRLQAELHGLVGISPYELVYGIQNSHIVNAAFTHTSDFGSRFNDSTRGAWYAAYELKTSIAEVAYHKARRLAEIVVPELPGRRPDEESSTYDDWLADFRTEFHVLEPAKDYSEFLQAEPVPACYAGSQQFARELLTRKSNGLVYPSVRQKGRRCIVCFRPALVYNPRRDQRVEISFKATASGYEHNVRKHSNSVDAESRK